MIAFYFSYLSVNIFYIALRDTQTFDISRIPCCFDKKIFNLKPFFIYLSAFFIFYQCDYKNIKNFFILKIKSNLC